MMKTMTSATKLMKKRRMEAKGRMKMRWKCPLDLVTVGDAI